MAPHQLTLCLCHILREIRSRWEQLEEKMCRASHPFCHWMTESPVSRDGSGGAFKHGKRQEDQNRDLSFAEKRDRIHGS